MKDQQGYTSFEFAIAAGIGMTVGTIVGALVVVIHFVAKYW